jgi:hypothetical protein
MGRFHRARLAKPVVAFIALGCNGLAKSRGAEQEPPRSAEAQEMSPAPAPEAPELDAPIPTAIDRCTDGVVDDTESDVDCGGSCGACAEGQLCNDAADCASRSCVGVCQPVRCDDGIRNGDENDVDCGGECGIQSCPNEFDVCNCAQSESLRALSCGWGAASWFHSTPTGDAVAYSVNSHSYLWTLSAGVELLMPRSDVLGLSDDARVAQLAQFFSGDGVIWRRDEPNEVFSSGGPYGLTADGRLVFTQGYSSGAPPTVAGREPIVIDIAETDRAEFMARDGSAVVGARLRNSPESASGYVEEAMLWTERAGARVIGPLPAGASNATADAVTSGGAVVAGWLSDAEHTALGVYRYTELDGMTLIIRSRATWVPTLLSDDGTTVVSSDEDEQTVASTAQRWTLESGTVTLAPGDGRSTYPNAMTSDGRTIVGQIAPNAGGFHRSPAEGVTPFLWRSDLGFVELPAALASSGVNLQGWQLGYPGSVSADGRVIVGNAECGGVPSVYRLVLPW